MPYTDRLRSELNTKRLEVGQTFKDCRALASAIEQLVSDFIDRHGGDLEDTLGGINDSLSDLLDSVTKARLQDIEEMEQRLADYERRDMWRCAPVTI